MYEKENNGKRPRFGQIANIVLAGMVFVPALALGYACGGSSKVFPDGGGGGTSSGASSGASGGASGGASSGNSSGINLSSSGSGGGTSSGNMMGTGTANGTFNAPDCAGCTFPPLTATACASSAPAIKVIYPNNGVLVPPNMNVISVQWTPFGSTYKTFEVDFANQVTDTRVITKCATQTMDTSQPVQASGGCDLELPQAAWTLLTGANRGGAAVVVTVRGSTDGMCATKSQDSIKMSFATEDLLGAIYYWKSTVTSNGTGGQIWEKNFGDTVAEKQVTGTAGSALSASCNGCHVLSRDGQRMVVYSDDDDSDDEYSDVLGSLIDLGANVVVGGTGMGRVPGTQPPGFSTISPTHTSYLTSDGLGTAPTNNFVLYNGNTAATMATITFGAAADRPTMPDWSPDGKEVVYVLPNKVATWDGIFGGIGARNDDDHMFGGSLYKLPYSGNGQFGTPAVFLQSAGENNYYPSFSPDGQYIVFDRAPASTAVSAIEGCNGTSPQVSCPNDSFSNPAARLMLVNNLSNAKPIDLQNANGSPAAGPLPLSNSWPRWSPFVQTYKGGRLLWVAFSSTRDYGLLVRNHLAGMYQCYPADSYQLAGGAHHSTFDPLCQQPKLWMAAINLNETAGTDPSYPAFYLPFQDISTHNHTPQWTQQVVTKPPVDAGACVPNGGNCLTGGTCCSPLACNGNGTCITVVP